MAKKISLGIGGQMSQFFDAQGHFPPVVHGAVVNPICGEEEKAGDLVFEKERAGGGVTLGKAVVEGEEGGWGLSER